MEGHHSWEVLESHTRLFVSFGGVPAKNGQVSAGGVIEHRVRPALARLFAAGCRMVNISPVRDNFDAPEGAVEWVPIRPNTDTAAMLALACEIVRNGTHDVDFLQRYCIGFERWADYLLGREDGVPKDAAWAAPITGIPAVKLRQLAVDLVSNRSIVNAAWALQRAKHGEQPYWAVVALAAVIGQVGLPGGGFGVAYGAANVVGSPHPRLKGPTLPQGRNPVSAFIPVARIADMLLNPKQHFDYNGGRYTYPDIELIYWAGGNPFHHHQDLNRLARAWHKPATVVVHEQVWNAHARMADVVLPATSTLERDDLGFSPLEPLMIAMKAAQDSPGDARDDYEIFGGLAERLGVGADFTEGLTVSGWLQRMYAQMAEQAAPTGFHMPTFDEFWTRGELRLPIASKPTVMLQAFREDPESHALRTPSGRIELHSDRVASFGYEDCPGHPVWREPPEWLGGTSTSTFPLHLLSDQPKTKLHSQLDFSALSRGEKVDGRQPVHLHPDEARVRGIATGDMVRLFNARGSCLAAAVVTDAVMPGVLRMSTGAWWDPTALGDANSLDKHGNPNVLTLDVGTSRLAQGCAAQTCMVQIESYAGPDLPITAFELPRLL